MDTSTDRPRVALALGSGGARGYAHIGAIQVLEERGMEIVTVAGCSMGALVGALHSAGHLGAYTEWVTGLSQFDVLRLLDPSLSSPGAIRAEKILARVNELLGGVQIEDLPIPFTSVATDLLARKEVWFQRGPVDAAVRASISIPGIFTPVMLNGRLLVDGGIMDPVPVAPTASVRSDLTLAVDLGGGRSGSLGEGPESDTTEGRPSEEWTDRFRRGASNLLDRDLVRSLTSRFASDGVVDGDERDAGPDPDGDLVRGLLPTVEAEVLGADRAGSEEPDTPAGDGFGRLPAGLGRFDVMNQSLEAMQSVITRYRLAGHPPDVLVRVPKDACRTLDFHRAEEMIEVGRRLTSEALDRADVGGLRG